MHRTARVGIAFTRTSNTARPLTHAPPPTQPYTTPHQPKHKPPSAHLATPTTDNRQPTTPEHRRHTTSTWSRSGHQIRLTGPSTRDHAYTPTRNGQRQSTRPNTS